MLEHFLSNDIEHWRDQFFDLNPDAIEEEGTKKGKEYKNDMFKDILPALDRGDKKFYSTRTAEQKEEIAKSMWILMRNMSFSNRYPQHYMVMVNNLVNQDFNLFVKKVAMGKEGHPELQWMLLALCGTGERNWFGRTPVMKGMKKNKIEEALLKRYPLLRNDELQMLINMNSREELEEFFRQNGYDDAQIKEIFKGDAKSK